MRYDYLKNCDNEICLEAVRNDGRVLKFVKDQTNENQRSNQRKRYENFI